jgi:hypothetical protein
MPTPREIADACCAALKAAKQALPPGGKITMEQIHAIIEQAATANQSLPLGGAHGVAEGDAKPKVPKARLDALFDALAAVQGGNAKHMTKHARAAIAEARQQILSVTPDVTPERIAASAALYRRRWPTWTISPLALCKHWHELVPADPTIAAKRDIYQVPKGDWQSVAIKVSGLSALPDEWQVWAEIPADWRAKIVQNLP